MQDSFSVLPCRSQSCFAPPVVTLHLRPSVSPSPTVYPSPLLFGSLLSLLTLCLRSPNSLFLLEIKRVLAMWSGWMSFSHAWSLRQEVLSKNWRTPKAQTKGEIPSKSACMGWYIHEPRGGGGTPIVLFTGIMTSTKYVRILEAGLLPFVSEVFPDSHRFQQDNDPKHCSKYTRKKTGWELH